MPTRACTHLSAMLYKESLLLRRNKCRVIVEIAIPILLAVFYAYSFQDIPIEIHKERSNLDIAYYSSPKTAQSFLKAI